MAAMAKVGVASQRVVRVARPEQGKSRGLADARHVMSRHVGAGGWRRDGSPGCRSHAVSPLLCILLYSYISTIHNIHRHGTLVHTYARTHAHTRKLHSHGARRALRRGVAVVHGSLRSGAGNPPRQGHQLRAHCAAGGKACVAGRMTTTSC